MAAASSDDSSPSRNNRRDRVFVGNLPDDFLRPDAVPQPSRPLSLEEADRQTAIQLQQQLWSGAQAQSSGAVGQLLITVVEAALVKNYGMTRMDPYVRLRVGHTVYETHTDPNGARTPRWNKAIQCYLPHGVDTIYVEIFDECALSMDELIAWAHITIPPAVLQGEVRDDWFPLTGKQGDAKEGSVHLVFSYRPVAAGSFPVVQYQVPYATVPYATSVMPVAGIPPVMVMNVPAPMAHSPGVVYPAPVGGVAPQQVVQQNPTPAAVPPLTADEIKEIESMFPNVDKGVVQSVIEACGGRRDKIIDSLLEISSQ